MLEFTPGVTIKTLNPYEQRLGSDYIDNLLEIGVVLLPEVYKAFPKYKIERCFTPKSRLEDEGITINWEYRKFTRALGITFSIEDFNSSDAIAFCVMLDKEYNRKNHYIINSDLKSITILIKMRVGSIIEIFKDKRRTIK